MEAISKIIAKRKFFYLLRKVIFCLLLAFGFGCIFLFGGIAIICYGPSPMAKDTFIVSISETKVGTICANLLFNKQELDRIHIRNNPPISISPNEQLLTDSDKPLFLDEDLPYDKDELESIQVEENGIKIINISKPMFTGKLMVVNDPSMVKIASPNALGGDHAVGLTIDRLVKSENAAGGINASAFFDEDGHGNGGQPIGVVIKDGNLIAGRYDAVTSFVGFDYDNNLVITRLSGAKLISLGIRDGVSFSSGFISDGKRHSVEKTGGLSPQTCIGQTADGKVIMLVIDGRQPSSLGATYSEALDIMEEYGAVNAANLDSGITSIMYYREEILSSPASVYGSRQLPTAFVAK